MTRDYLSEVGGSFFFLQNFKAKRFLNDGGTLQTKNVGIPLLRYEHFPPLCLVLGHRECSSDSTNMYPPKPDLGWGMEFLVRE